MAHNIFFNRQTGKHCFFSVKQKAWHGLGQIVSDYPTSAEAIQYAGLNYEVIKTGLFTSAHDLTIGNGVETTGGGTIGIPGFFATQRTDNNAVLGVVGKDYEIVQNADAFSFFDSIVGGGDGILYETAGSLGIGERIFITAKLPGYIKVGSDDVIEKYLFLTTSHDGSGSITAAFTPVRVVCANTLSAALGNMTNVIRIRYTSNAKLRLETAHKVMGIANNLSAVMEFIFNQWSKIRVADTELRKLIRLAMSPNKETLVHLQNGNEDALSAVYKNACEDVFSYAMINDTQQTETTKGTLFGAFNAVTGYFQNVRSYSNDEAKVKSILMGGTAATRTQKAFNLCAGFAKAANSALQLN